jgi:hypothetical protein
VSGDPDTPPPFGGPLGRWSRVYTLVLGVEALVIVLLVVLGEVAS